MPFIRWIDESDADGRLGELYARLTGARGLDHILKIHALNPESLHHHYEFYNHLMRGPSDLSRAEREIIAVVVSVENHCVY